MKRGVFERDNGRWARECKSMSGPDPDALRAALRGLRDPASGRDIVAAGLLEGIQVRGGLVQASLLTDRKPDAASHGTVAPRMPRRCSHASRVSPTRPWC